MYERFQFWLSVARGEKRAVVHIVKGASLATRPMTRDEALERAREAGELLADEWGPRG